METGAAVTVILPHFKCERYLHLAAASILSQTFSNLVLIVVDDHSSDDAWLRSLNPVLSDRRLCVRRTSTTVGPYRIVNALIPAIRSPLIAFQDADDISHPERLARQLRFMAESAADIVGCHFRCIGEDGRPLPFWKTLTIARFIRDVRQDKLAHHPTTVVKREVFEALGGYDGTTRFGADTEFMTRARYLFTIRNTPEALYDYRLRRGSLALSATTGAGSSAREAYKRDLQRRAREWESASDPAILKRLLFALPTDIEFTMELLKDSC